MTVGANRMKRISRSMDTPCKYSTHTHRKNNQKSHKPATNHSYVQKESIQTQSSRRALDTITTKSLWRSMNLRARRSELNSHVAFLRHPKTYKTCINGNKSRKEIAGAE